MARQQPGATSLLLPLAPWLQDEETRSSTGPKAQLVLRSRREVLRTMSSLFAVCSPGLALRIGLSYFLEQAGIARRLQCYQWTHAVWRTLPWL